MINNIYDYTLRNCIITENADFSLKICKLYICINTIKFIN